MKNNNYLIFQLGDTHYALNTDNVQSILGLCKISKIPKSPPFVEGFINFRDRTLMIIDIKKILKINDKNQNNNIIVLNDFGILIDSVKSVIEMKEGDILKLPMGNDHLIGTVEIDDKLILILDVKDILI